MTGWGRTGSSHGKAARCDWFSATVLLTKLQAVHSSFRFPYRPLKSTQDAIAAAEKARLGLSASPERHPPLIRHRASQGNAPEGAAEGSAGSPDSPFPLRRSARQRKLSHSNAAPRRQGRKMALFEGSAGAPPASLARATHLFASGVPGAMSALSSEEHLPAASPPTGTGHDRPYRFSFYSNGLSATIHARSLSELPAEGQTFEDLFGGASGVGAMGGDAGAVGPIHIPAAPQSNGNSFHSGSAGGAMYANGGSNGNNGSSKKALNDQRLGNDPEGQTWWLDVLSPTDEEMKMLSRVSAVHSLLRFIPIICAGLQYPSTHDGGYPDGGSAREDRPVQDVLPRLFPELRPGPV